MRARADRHCRRDAMLREIERNLRSRIACAYDQHALSREWLSIAIVSRRERTPREIHQSWECHSMRIAEDARRRDEHVRLSLALGRRDMPAAALKSGADDRAMSHDLQVEAFGVRAQVFHHLQPRKIAWVRVGYRHTRETRKRPHRMEMQSVVETEPGRGGSVARLVDDRVNAEL